jgi:hypothetical protein
MNPGDRVGSGFLTCGRAKIREEACSICIVFPACVVNRVKWTYWAPHAFDAVSQKDRDGRGPSPHHVVDETFGLKTHVPRLRRVEHPIRAAYGIFALPQ